MTEETKLDLMQGDLETGMYLEQSGYGKPTKISYALRRQASQENCDGDPYEAMVFASKYIDKLEEDREMLHRMLCDAYGAWVEADDLFMKRVEQEVQHQLTLEDESVYWNPRGIGSNWNIPDLRTGECDGKLHPDCSGFVKSKSDGEKAVRIFGHNAFLDYRPSEPNWVQVKVSCDEKTLGILYELVRANNQIVTRAIVRQALREGSEE